MRSPKSLIAFEISIITLKIIHRKRNIDTVKMKIKARYSIHGMKIIVAIATTLHTPISMAVKEKLTFIERYISLFRKADLNFESPIDNVRENAAIIKPSKPPVMTMKACKIS